MLSLSEIRSMEDALKAHDAFIAALRREYDKTSRLDIFSDTRERAKTILGEATANQARFIDRRNYLIETEPSDHEAVLLFVTGIRKIAGSPLPVLVATERESGSTANIVAGALADTAKDIGQAFKFGLPALAIIAIAYLVWKGSRK